MMRQFLLSALGLILFSCADSPRNPTDLIAMVPEKASAVVRINQYDSFKSQLKNNELLEVLGQSTTLKKGETLLRSLQYLQPKGEAILYFTEIGKDNFEYTIMVESHQDLFRIDSTLNHTVQSITYDNAVINKLNIENNPFYTTNLGDFFIASSSQFPVEDIIRNIDKQTPVKDLEKLYEVTQNSTAATLFINNKQSAGLLGKIMNKETAGVFRSMSDWSSLDLKLEEDIVKGNGIALAGDSLPNILNKFKYTVPQKGKLAEVTPVNSSYLINFTGIKGLVKNPARAEDSLFVSAEEAGFIKVNGNEIWVLRFPESVDATNVLAPYTEQKYSFRNHPFIKLNNKDLIRERFGFIKGTTPSAYAGVMGAYLFLSDKEETLKDLVANVQNHAVLSRLESYKEMRKDLADEASVEVMVNLANLRKDPELLSDDLKSALKNLKNQDLLAMQYVMEGEFAHLNLLSKKYKTPVNKNALVTQVFNTNLDAPLHGKPVFVYNHRTKKKEVAVQDTNNDLYLIATDGKVLWKKKLDGPILGEIAQVDLYRNGRFQLAFTTAEKLYVVDRNGNDVAPFPITSKAPITKGLSIFDYDNNKNYRFCLTNNNKITLYDRKGQLVTGFNMKTTSSPIAQRPKHIRLGNKDFIVVRETAGKLHLLYRTGEPRINIKQELNLSDNEVFLYNNSFAMTSAEGELITIDANGKIRRTPKPFGAAHRIDATLHTLAAVSDNQLYIKDQKTDLDYGAYTTPKIFYIYDKIYVALTDTEGQQVYLFDSKAKMIENFPVYGNSAVDLDDINNDRKIDIVTTGDNNSVVVYSLQ